MKTLQEYRQTVAQEHLFIYNFLGEEGGRGVAKMAGIFDLGSRGGAKHIFALAAEVN